MKRQAVHKRHGRGFERTSTLVQSRVRDAGASRGFAVPRLLTHWGELAGEDIASIARPVDVKYGRDGFGATLTLLTTGAQAPMLEMQKEVLRDRVNACYGYRAISRIRITQTAPSGFAEGRADFAPAPIRRPQEKPSPDQIAKAEQVASTVGDADLRAALEALGQKILSNPKTNQNN